MGAGTAVTATPSSSNEARGPGLTTSPVPSSRALGNVPLLLQSLVFSLVSRRFQVHGTSGPTQCLLLSQSRKVRSLAREQGLRIVWPM